MCGRYALSATATELIEHFRLLSCPEFGLRFNIAPQSMVPVIRQKPGAGRVGQLVKWGLIPSWAKDQSIGAKLNNARGETVAEKPAFRSSFAKHRCLIPASGFYEWQPIAGRKQPYYIHPSAPGDLFAFAGLLAAWKLPEGETVVSTSIITTRRIQPVVATPLIQEVFHGSRSGMDIEINWARSDALSRCSFASQ
jgi:putative SOS response-associated peptidase YedK